MIKHKLTLLGGSPTELRVPADALIEALGALIEGARQATRFFVEGESTRKGPRPTWLDSACHFDITNLLPGSVMIEIEAPTLEEADPIRFGNGGQGTLFEEPAQKMSQRTAIELFGSVLASVVEGKPEDIMADRLLLDTCVRFTRVASGTFNGVRLEGLKDRTEPVTVRPDDAPRFELLRDQIPEPQAVRISGVLDTISASRSDVILSLPEGAKVAAHLESHDPTILRRLFGGRVVISGVAHFRPSGQLLFVHAESISEAREADAVFASIPLAKRRRSTLKPVAQDETTGVSAFFGTWPGDESEDDLLKALRAIG